MSDPIARPHKRLATLTGAGIAAMLSPSGKIISSAAAAGIIVAAVATQVIDDRARVATLPSASTHTTPSAPPVSHVVIPGAGGEEIPVVLTEHPSEERVNTPIEVGNEMQSRIPQTHAGSPGSRSVAAPLVVASLPPPSVRSPFLPLPLIKTPPPPLLEPEVLDPEIVWEKIAEDGVNEEGKPEEKTPENTETDTGPIGGPPEQKEGAPEQKDPPIITSVFPPRVTAGGDGGTLPGTGPGPTTLADVPLLIAAVSEPGLLGLMLAGLGGIAWTGRRRPPA